MSIQISIQVPSDASSNSAGIEADGDAAGDVQHAQHLDHGGRIEGAVPLFGIEQEPVDRVLPFWRNADVLVVFLVLRRYVSIDGGDVVRVVLAGRETFASCFVRSVTVGSWR